MPQHYETKNLRRCFLLPIYSWAWGLPWRMVDFLSETLLEQTNFASASGCQESFWGRDECVSTSFSSRIPSDADVSRPCAWCHSSGQQRHFEISQERESENGTKREANNWGRKENGHELPAESHLHSLLAPPSFWSVRITQVAPLLASSQIVTWQLESKRGRGELPEHFIAFISHPNI